ncbi:hypothetical protein J5N97_022496 [Dioscorea zingiberensis]|uniref:Uncharacterized protein n=1 Tax=Dioscorea zingiberensis TaxID=325984 RepID=A0A9D5HAQ5_9LILI|nr:hypothetical protein J5N97_022496 [Dioscorea zingiberensis]
MGAKLFNDEEGATATFTDEEETTTAVGESARSLPEDKTALIKDKGDRSRDSFLLVDDTLAVGLELLQNHLYRECMDKDFLLLLFDEQEEVKMEFDQRSSEQIGRLWDLVKGKVMVTEELASCHSEFHRLAMKMWNLNLKLSSYPKKLRLLKVLFT